MCAWLAIVWFLGLRSFKQGTMLGAATTLVTQSSNWSWLSCRLLSSQHLSAPVPHLKGPPCHYKTQIEAACVVLGPFFGGDPDPSFEDQLDSLQLSWRRRFEVAANLTVERSPKGTC